MSKLSSFAVLVLTFLSLSSYVHAGCSRPIVVPASPLGKMLIVSESSGEVSGVYAQMLRGNGKRAGCEFTFPVVPRARAERMVQTGGADMLIGAVKVPQRAAWGEFIPLMNVEWMLISNNHEAAPKSVQELLNTPGIHVNVVRSFNAGPAYLALLDGLEKRGVLEYVDSPQTIVRKMQAGRVNYTIMPSGTFAGSIDELGLQQTLGKTVRYTHLDGLPLTVTGVYVSKLTPRSDVVQISRILAGIREDHDLFMLLHSVFSPEEMISYRELPAGDIKSSGKIE